MARKGKPIPPERNYTAIYWCLTPDEQKAYRAAWRLTDEWQPPILEMVSRPRALEKLRELERIMKMKPRALEQWPEERIQRVDPVEGE